MSKIVTSKEAINMMREQAIGNSLDKEWITNFPTAKGAGEHKKYAKDLGYVNVVVVDKAYDTKGRLLSDHKALYGRKMKGKKK
jgi:hypothetical protein